MAISSGNVKPGHQRDKISKLRRIDYVYILKCTKCIISSQDSNRLSTKQTLV